MDEKHVQVRFINAETGDILFEREMSPAQLPQSFEAQATFHFDDERWEVIKAVPMIAKEFTQTGKLLVSVKHMKIMKMPPEDMLFTLPTICNELPMLVEESTKLGKSVYEMHEDDWRQIEFVSTSFKKEMEAELVEVTRIYREQSVNVDNGLGFRTVHIRRQISVPIQTEFTLSQVQHYFPGIEQHYDGIGFLQYAGLIEGGFAFNVGPIVCYGQQSDGFVRVCCLAFKAGTKGNNSPDWVTAFARLITEHDLSLVDWCKARPMTAQTIGKYLDTIEDVMGRWR